MADSLSRLHPVFAQLLAPWAPPDREDQRHRGQLRTVGPELVSETMADGTVCVARICVRHQWASRFVEDVENALPCPLCRCEIEEEQGRLRYAILHHRKAFGI